MLIDANLEHPVLHTAFNILPTPGLRDVLANNTECFKGIHKSISMNVNVIPAGTPMMRNSGSIDQRKFSDLIASARTRYAYVLIDSSPLLKSSDSLSSAIAADTTFLVVQACKTQSEVAEEAKFFLQKHGCQIGGIILNRLPQVIPEWIYKRL